MTLVIPAWKLNAVQVLALACVGAWAGAWIKRKARLLDRLNIPAPIIGGMLFATAALVLRDRYANFEVDTTLRDLLMIAFMTTIGLSASYQLIRVGGVKVLLLLALASVGAILQNLLGIGLAKLLGIDARLGILAGSVALAGGPATSLAFGGTFERMGVRGAMAVAFASATFGIAVAGLIGGYVGGLLIRRHKLRPGTAGGQTEIAKTVDGSTDALFPMVLLIGVAMGLGSLLSAEFERLNVILPSYIGAMIVAAVIRNVDDRYRFFRISQPDVNTVGRISLQLFIVMALITLRLWELAHLALPVFAILVMQVVLCCLMCLTVVFWIMGRDYESAVTSSGFCGFMLGITANAVACMEELVEKYGPAPQAFLVVPIVGAFLIDFTNSLIITTMANLMR